MKKLLVIALAAIFVLAFAALTMAEATLSGAVETGFKTTTYNSDFVDDFNDLRDAAIAAGATDAQLAALGLTDAMSDKTTSTDYAKGKVTLNGKLGDDCTGKAVVLGDPVSGIKWDEADVTFTEGFGTLKFGYFGWNNNLKDILDTYRGDIKTQFVSSAAIKASENFTIGIAYGYRATDAEGEKEDANADYTGIDLGFATDTFGVDVIMTNNGGTWTIPGQDDAVAALDNYSTTGVQGWYKLDAFKFFLQYITVDSKVAEDLGLEEDDVAPTNEIIGFTYEPADAPFYGRFEYDLSNQDDLYGDYATNQMGLRAGYKFADGAKVEYQNFTNNWGTNQSYLKLICEF